MRGVSSVKRKIQIKDENGIVIPLANVPIFVSITRGTRTIKTFGNALWTDDTYNTPLSVDTVDNFFLVLLSGDEIDSMLPGSYDLNIWWKEVDTDYNDGTKRMYLEAAKNIIIPNE